MRAPKLGIITYNYTSVYKIMQKKMELGPFESN